VYNSVTNLPQERITNIHRDLAHNYTLNHSFQSIPLLPLFLAKPVSILIAIHLANAIVKTARGCEDSDDFV
jgi:hypothetical protein